MTENDKNLQCRINFVSTQIRENRIEHEKLMRELKKELEKFQTKRVCASATSVVEVH
jgi:hypothetical protein